MFFEVTFSPPFHPSLLSHRASRELREFRSGFLPRPPTERRGCARLLILLALPVFLSSSPSTFESLRGTNLDKQIFTDGPRGGRSNKCLIVLTILSVLHEFHRVLPLVNTNGRLHRLSTLSLPPFSLLLPFSP